MNTGLKCSSNGDGLCYPTCKTNADCTDPRFPTCGTIWVFNGSDAGQYKYVCQPKSTLPLCGPLPGGGGTGGGGVGGGMGASPGEFATGGRSGGAGGNGGGRGGSGGSGGSGGYFGGGGNPSGGVVGSGGSGAGGASPVIDAGARDGDSPAGIDGPANACSVALPITKCSGHFEHSTVVEGRANLWNGYSRSARLESGRETVYLFDPHAAGCVATARLTNLTVDLDLFLLSACDPGANLAASSTPLGLQTEETVSWTLASGAIYYLVVDGYAGAEGGYTLDITCQCK